MRNTKHGAVITGMGVVSPIGIGIPDFLQGLLESRSGISEISKFSTEGLSVSHASVISDSALRDADPVFFDRWCSLDRTGLLALMAAREAVAHANLLQDDLRSGRVGLVAGICAGGIGNGLMPALTDQENDATSASALKGLAHHEQTHAVTQVLGITGPTLTVSTACSSSTSALSSALTMIESGSADAVLVGGADAFSLSIYAGFYSLGAMSSKPTSPFSTELGASFGEGAGFIVLESAAHAQRRQAQVFAILQAVGNTSDAHHVTSPHPAGEGLRRAMQLALIGADVDAKDIAYINCHGTGTQDNDITETIAIHSLFQEHDLPVPPVSSSKSYFGHTLGGAGILEFIASLLGLLQGFLPATINFSKARAGCDLDYVPNQIRPAKLGALMSNSAAFGGINSVALATAVGHQQKDLPAFDNIVISGMGLVSALGIGKDAFLNGLKECKDGIVCIDRPGFDTRTQAFAGLVPAYQAQRVVPTIDMRRMDNFTRNAITAAASALKDAGLQRFKAERVGIHVAMTRGPVTAIENFRQGLHTQGIANLSAKLFPAIVLSTISGQVALACQIKGASFTFVEGPGAGLQALIHGSHYLNLHPELDALVVLAVDEVAPMTHKTFDVMGKIAHRKEGKALFSPDSTGTFLGEGAVAFVLERAASAQTRKAKPLAVLTASAMNSDGYAGTELPGESDAFHCVLEQVMNQSGKAPEMLYGAARGLPLHDQREANAVRKVLQRAPAAGLTCLSGQLGMCEASGSLFSVAAAILGMQYGLAFATMRAAHAPADLPLQRETGASRPHTRALVFASSECGNNAALMLEAIPANGVAA